MANCLIGKTIQSMKIAKDKKAIMFVTDGAEIIAKADGDCCSSTWIEHVGLPAMGFPCYVFAAEDVDMPDLGQPDKYGKIAYYGFKIDTDKGTILLDYRNESNGYYGGNLSWSEDYHYGRVYGQNNSNEEWVELGSNI